MMPNGVMHLLSRGVSLNCFRNFTARSLAWAGTPLKAAKGLRGMEAFFIPDLIPCPQSHER